jgi:cytochrome P450
VSFWNPDTFEDPSAFKPERWEKATKAMNDSVTPFTLGKRNCILGQALAKAELQSVLPMLVSKYRFELVEDVKTDTEDKWSALESLSCVNCLAICEFLVQ